MQDVLIASFGGQSKASHHNPTATMRISEIEFRSASVVLSIRPTDQMTWGSFYDTNVGIERAFRDTLMNETCFDIMQNGIGVIGSGEVVNTALVRDWSM